MFAFCYYYTHSRLHKRGVACVKPTVVMATLNFKRSAGVAHGNCKFNIRLSAIGA